AGRKPALEGRARMVRGRSKHLWGGFYSGGGGGERRGGGGILAPLAGIKPALQGRARMVRGRSKNLWGRVYPGRRRWERRRGGGILAPLAGVKPAPQKPSVFPEGVPAAHFLPAIDDAAEQLGGFLGVVTGRVGLAGVEGD